MSTDPRNPSQKTESSSFQDKKTFYPRTGFTAPYPDEEIFPDQAEGGRRRARSLSHPVRKNKNHLFWTGIFLFSLALLCVLFFVLYSLHAPYEAFETLIKADESNTFASGIYVDGLSIGGLTYENAKALLETKNKEEVPLSIDISIDEDTWHLTSDDIQFTQSVDSILQKAYSIGRQGSVQTLSSSMTPFEYRTQVRSRAAAQNAYYYSDSSYNREAVMALCNKIASYVRKDPVNSTVETFDFSTKTFTFTNEEEGREISPQLIFESLIELLENKKYTGSFSFESNKIMPQTTKVQLMNSFTKISAFSTKTTSDENRNINIMLACSAVNGLVIMPGETFSFNSATGERTEEKGYRSAPAIAGGTTVNETGGGVCQVSSTLFNAAVMADMTIISRSPHTWPSNYVDKGLDATVNWPNLDFSFRNDTDSPVFLICWYENRTCNVEIYGKIQQPGVQIILEPVTTSTTEPPREPTYILNPALQAGTQNIVKKAHTGYTVDTYKVYMLNGAEIKRELLCTSVYKMIEQVIEYNE